MVTPRGSGTRPFPGTRGSRHSLGSHGHTLGFKQKSEPRVPLEPRLKQHCEVGANGEGLPVGFGIPRLPRSLWVAQACPCSSPRPPGAPPLLSQRPSPQQVSPFSSCQGLSSLKPLPFPVLPLHESCLQIRGKQATALVPKRNGDHGNWGAEGNWGPAFKVLHSQH